MNWKKSIDDVKIYCNSCNKEMILESSLNLEHGIYFCPKCKERVNVGLYDFVPKICKHDLEEE